MLFHFLYFLRKKDIRIWNLINPKAEKSICKYYSNINVVILEKYQKNYNLLYIK